MKVTRIPSVPITASSVVELKFLCCFPYNSYIYNCRHGIANKSIGKSPWLMVCNQCNIQVRRRHSWEKFIKNVSDMCFGLI